MVGRLVVMRNFAGALVATGLTCALPAMGGERFDKVQAAFESALPVTSASLAVDSAWAGYCVDPSEEIDDSMMASRSSDDPLMGPEVRAHIARTVGSNNYFVRMDEKAAREYVETTDPSVWTPGTWIDGELFLQALDRYQTILREAGLKKPNGDSDRYYVAARRCRSFDGIKCNGSGNTPFITYEICYFYARKY